jgi:hypothetical protein
MAVITAAVKINGQPLKRAFVEHRGPFGFGSLGFDLTDSNGSFTFDAGLLSNQIDIKIHCQNSVIRVVNGGLFNSGISFSTTVTNGAIVSITTNPDHFKILNICLDVYDTVWKQFSPYSKTSRGDFPLGKKPTFRETFSSNRRIELTYPDNFPSLLAFVEPSGLTNDGFPLAHIKHRTLDGRLFGEGDAVAPRHDASLLPHELGHVFHFSSLTANTRTQVEGEYLAFLAGQIPSGNFSHNVNVATSPVIAFIEAVGIFSERFFAFKKLIKPNLSGVNLRQAFFRDELAATSSLGARGVLNDKYVQVGSRGSNGVVTPIVTTGDNVEGSVYGAIYLDFASRVGLKEAVGLVLESNATTFDNFRNHVSGKNDTQLTNAINAVKQTWNL